VRSTSTVLLFLFVAALTTFSVIVVWPSTPDRYLPGEFWPHGRGIKIGGWERETMRLGLDLRGGAYLVLQADPPPDYEGDLGQALDGAKDVVERRVNEFGVSEAEINKTSGNRISVQVPGLSLDEARNLIGKTAALQFMTYDDSGQRVPATGVIDGQTVAMTGSDIKNNTFASRQGTTFAVNFETTSRGSKLMQQITSRATQYPSSDSRNYLVVMLDNVVLSEASVNAVISDSGSITGQPSFSAANDLSKQLNAGALPIPLTIIQSDEVSATLGEDSVLSSVRAGQIGLVAVMLFMILYYRLPGVLASAALMVYSAMTLMIFKVVPVTLTLSGIAAFVLSIGIAVDANILIFERMKEELRKGRTLNAAIDIGFRRAWSSIRDSNVSTLITCGILYYFGANFGAAVVQGFALTLALGVFVSMFSAITVTRTFLKMIQGTPLARNHWLFNADEVRRPPVSARRSAAAAATPATTEEQGNA
jgi:preprotein translocase subunit SecD